MKTPKKRVVRPQARTPRKRFLYADVTNAEQDEIQQYCKANGISVSQFMADLLLEDARESRTKPKQNVILRPKIELTPKQQDKLETLARLHQKKSVSEYILDVLEPQLELRRIHRPLKTKMLRYYLSDQEYETVSDHITESGLSPGSYSAMIALRAIRKNRRNHSK